MLLPRLSIRWLAVLLALCGLVFWVLSHGVRGTLYWLESTDTYPIDEPALAQQMRANYWALALLTPLAGLLLALISYALLFLLSYVVWQVRRTMSSTPGPGSPFATHVPPPRIIRAPDPP